MFNIFGDMINSMYFLETLNCLDTLDAPWSIRDTSNWLGGSLQVLSDT